MRLINEVRMYIAEKFLYWSFDIAPDTSEGVILKEVILEYLIKIIKK